MPSEEQQETTPWAQLPDETALWFGRFERYRLMWPHSIPEVYRDEWRAERHKAQQAAEKSGKEQGIDITLEQEAPKEAPSKWYSMAKRYRWEECASAWDAAQMAAIEQKLTEEKARVLLTGYAITYRRVAQLNEQAEQLIAMTKDPNKVWVPDVKSIGSGPMAERVDLVQFNDALFREIRATFDDIAKELGERIKRQEIKATILPKSYLESKEDLDDDGVDR